MPEGPDIKVLINNLNKTFKNKNLENIEILKGRYLKKKPDNYDDFIKELPLKILNIKCKGKFIYYELENNWLIFNTLGLSGKYTYNDKLNNNNLLFTIKGEKIYYNDMRNFGTFKFIYDNDNKILEKKLKTLGADILENEFTEEYNLNIFKTKKYQMKTIVELLMNQKLYCGLGNYLKSEILYECKISPHRLIKDFNENEINLLYKNIKKISNKFYILGSPYKTHLESIDENKDLKKNFEVYNKKKDKNNNIIKRETTKDKRTTHWVPDLQI